MKVSERCALALAVALGAAAALPAAPASAQREAVAQGEPDSRDHRLTWSPYRRFRPVEYTLTFGAPVVFRVIDFNTREASEPRWNRPILLDATIRGWLRAESYDGRVLAAEVSNWTWYVSMAWPFVDAIAVALIADRNPDVAWQLSALGLQAFALSGFISLTSIKATARARPTRAECRADPGYHTLCGQGLRSFPSGHVAGGFAGAGLVCVSHAHLPLYGGGVLDAAACATALTVATTSAIGRVITDRHYASDVIVGAGLGLSLGWLMPWLLHYRSDGPPALALVPALDEHSLTLTATGAL
jgi:membrane-associated phospholipid phosphatase